MGCSGSPARHVRSWLAIAGAVALAVTGLTVVANPAAASPSGCADSAITVTSLNPPVFYRDASAVPVLDAGYAGYAVSTTAQRSDVWVQMSGFSTPAPSPATSVLGLASTQPASLPLRTLTAGTTTPAFFLLRSSGASAYEQDQTVTVYAGKPGTTSATVLCTTTSSFASVQETIKAAANKLQPTFGDPAAVQVATSAAQVGGTVTVTVDGNTGTIGSGMTGDPNALYMTPTAVSSFPARAFRLVHTSLKISPDGTAGATTTSDVLHVGNLGSTARDYQAVYTFTITGTTGGAATSPWPVQQISSGTQVKHTDTSSFSTLIPPIPAPTNPFTVTVDGAPTSLPSSGGTSTVTLTLGSSAPTTASIDGLAATLPAGVTYVPGSTQLDGVAAADPASAGSTLSWDGPFSASSSSPRVLTFQVAVPAVPGAHTVTGYGVAADNMIGRTGATDGSDIGSVTLVVPGLVLDQTITFPTLPDTILTALAPVPEATATSGLPVTYSSTTPSVCTISGSTLTLLHTGTCTIAADQAGDTSWNAAPTVSRSFAVTPAGQTVTPTQPSDLLVSDAEALYATASSGLDVTWSSTTPSVCTVSGTTVTAVAIGTCTLAADQGGNGDWSAAPQATVSFAVGGKAQAITFPALPDTVLADAAPALAATSSSGLAISYSSLTPSVCTVSAGVLQMVTAGVCTIAADQPGDATTWAAAPEVTRSFTITVPVVPPPSPPSQTITFPVPGALPGGGIDPALDGVATSGLPVTYSSSTPDVCQVIGSTLVVLASGTCTLTATQPGDGTYPPAAPVTISFPATVPTVGTGTTTTVGTNPGTVPVGGVPTGATLVVPGGLPPGAVSVTVSGGVLQVVPAPGFSGVITVPVVVTLGAATVVTHVTVLVLPAPPSHVLVTTRNLTSTVSWVRSPNATGYVVRVNGRVACRTTSTTSCRLVRVLGPRDVVTVTALGNAGTRSGPAPGRAKVAAPVKLGTVYFDTDSAVLTGADKTLLRRIARTMRLHGLRHLWLSGYTDNQAGYAYNLALSARRARAVAGFLQHLLPRAHVDFVLTQHSYLHPAASNTSARGRALNRRTEIAAS